MGRLARAAVPAVGGLFVLCATAALWPLTTTGCLGCAANDVCLSGTSRAGFTIDLSCTNTDLVGVQLSGACSDDAGADGGWTPASYSEFGSTVYVEGDGLGDCHFDLQFADGFTYSGDVHLAEYDPGCGCPPYPRASPSTVTVSNPSSTCITDLGTPDVLASQQDGPTGVAIDSTSAYWVVLGFDGWMYDGSVMKAALDGSSVTTLATGQGIPQSIAVDATSVYWTNTAPGAVMKLTPK